jgi:hypothetical protein
MSDETRTKEREREDVALTDSILAQNDRVAVMQPTAHPSTLSLFSRRAILDSRN